MHEETCFDKESLKNVIIMIENPNQLKRLKKICAELDVVCPVRRSKTYAFPIYSTFTQTSEGLFVVIYGNADLGSYLAAHADSKGLKNFKSFERELVVANVRGA